MPNIDIWLTDKYFVSFCACYPQTSGNQKFITQKSRSAMEWGPSGYGIVYFLKRLLLLSFLREQNVAT